MTPCNGACVRLRWQVRRDEQEKQSQPRQPDPSLERWFYHCSTFCAGGCVSSHAPRQLHRFCRCPIAAVPAATVSFVGAFFTTWLTIWPAICGFFLGITTSLLSSNMGFPEHNATCSSADGNTACGAGVIHLIAGGARATGQPLGPCRRRIDAARCAGPVNQGAAG